MEEEDSQLSRHLGKPYLRHFMIILRCWFRCDGLGEGRSVGASGNVWLGRLEMLWECWMCGCVDNLSIRERERERERYLHH